MQAIEVKAEVEGREPAVAEKTEDSPGATKEDSCCAVPAVRKGRWRPWLIGGAVLVPIALYGGWDWLVAAGLSTFIIAVAPCLVMCALGLCMRGQSKDESSLAQIRKTYETPSGEPPARG